MIENKGQEWIGPILDDYLSDIPDDIDSLILGCTHYPLLKSEIQSRVGKHVTLISQDDIIPLKLEDYLKRHNNMQRRLSENGTMKYIVSDITQSYQSTANIITGEEIELQKPIRW